MRSREIRRVLDRGRSLHGERVVLFLAPGSTSSSASGSGGIAVVVARRVGNAVERNRARRILRAAWREVTPGIAGGDDVVLVARKGIRGARTQDLVIEMTQLVDRAEVTPR